ncbi:MAG: hypothetical protein WCA61_10560 [Nitrososphaeraceae archaeon]
MLSEEWLEERLEEQREEDNSDCPRCGTKNRITLENGELKKQV